jgi:hypothetical protein
LRLAHRYSDFSDPTNLFSLAINSPPSKKLADCSCGAVKDSGDRFKYHWKMGDHDGHIVMESPDAEELDDLGDGSPSLRKRMRYGFNIRSLRFHALSDEQ